jgi:hypothetical protein
MELAASKAAAGKAAAAGAGGKVEPRLGRPAQQGAMLAQRLG